MQIEVVDLDPVLTENFVKFCCNEFRVYPDLITIEGWDVPLKGNANGLCYEVHRNEEYLIYVNTVDRNVTEIYNTIAHEMIHVKQFIKNNLEELMNDIHKPVYEERWWEKEASKKSLELVKKYVDILYEMA